MRKNPAAVALGRLGGKAGGSKGGSSKSKAKKRAAIANLEKARAAKKGKA